MDLIDRQAAIDMIRLYREDEAVDLDELESSIAMMPSAQLEVPDFVEWRACETCRYNGLNWDEEPCDSCTNGGENNHWKPSAQPETIRCEDCKKYDMHDHRCKRWNHGVAVTDWCSRAERRTDETD